MVAPVAAENSDGATNLAVRQVAQMSHRVAANLTPTSWCFGRRCNVGHLRHRLGIDLFAETISVDNRLPMRRNSENSPPQNYGDEAAHDYSLLAQPNTQLPQFLMDLFEASNELVGGTPSFLGFAMPHRAL